MYNSIPKAVIHETLENILATKAFSKSPLISRFLRFVVEKTLDGHSNTIKEYTIGVKVMDKPHSFNPQLDASVRINAIRLRKMLAEYYEAHDGETILRIELPKGRYYPVFIRISGKELIVSPGDISATTEQGDTICILPFNGYIHPFIHDISLHGFGEYLSEKLSLFQDINVIGYHSSARYMEEEGQLSNIGNALGVTCYLTGDIEIENEDLQVSYELFEAQNNSLIWSHQITLSREATLMDAVDTITNQIAASLAGYSGYIHSRSILERNVAPPIGNKTANAIFWFYHYQVHHSETLFHEAIDKLEKVLHEDENCALCLAVLAHLYADALIYNYKTHKNPLETAKAYVNKCLSIDPLCQHAYLSKSWVHILLREKNEALVCLEKIMAINPNASIFRAMCSLGFAFLGEYPQSIDYVKRAKQLHPLPYWWMNVPEIFVALLNNDFEKVIFMARKSSTPQVIFEHIFEMIGLYYAGDTQTLRKILKIYKSKYPDGIAFISKALPPILFDDALAHKVEYALREIDRLSTS